MVIEDIKGNKKTIYIASGGPIESKYGLIVERLLIQMKKNYFEIENSNGNIEELLSDKVILVNENYNNRLYYMISKKDERYSSQKARRLDHNLAEVYNFVDKSNDPSIFITRRELIDKLKKEYLNRFTEYEIKEINS